MKNIANIKEFNNMKELIYHVANIYSNNIAFVIKEIENSKTKYINISYKEFLDDINRLGTSLYDLNLHDKKIAIIGRNNYNWALTHISILLGQMISVPLDKDLQYEELENSLIRSNVDAIFFDKKYIDKIEKIKENNTTNIKQYICMENLNGFTSINDLLIKGDLSIRNGNTSYINKEIDGNIMSILLFTSGTTSNSKAVMLSQRNVTSNIYAMQLTEDIRSTDTNIAFLPFHHIFGSTCLAMMLSCGVKTTFPDGLKYIKQNLKEYKVSLFVGVPILIEAIYKAINKELVKQNKLNLFNKMINISNFLLKFHIDIRRILFKQILNPLGGKLRFLISGGAPLDPVISKWFNDLGIILVQGYGLTETAPVIAAEDYKSIKFGSCGKPMQNLEIKIDNKDKKGIGQIKVKGPNVMLGYYKMPEITNEVIQNGWLDTGDLGYIDKDGFLFINGRTKNMIVLKNGKKIFPEEIETVISRLDIIKECMVFGIPDKNDNLDITLSIKIVYNEQVRDEIYKDISENDFYNAIWEQIKELNKLFPRYKHIQKMILTNEELIKTTTKKVKRQEEINKILKG